MSNYTVNTDHPDYTSIPCDDIAEAASVIDNMIYELKDSDPGVECEFFFSIHTLTHYFESHNCADYARFGDYLFWINKD